MTKGKVPYTVGVMYLYWRSQWWWVSLNLTLEFSVFSHSHSCFCSHPLQPLQCFSIMELSIGWEQVVARGSTSWSRAVTALLLCSPLIKDSLSPLGKAAGTPWSRGADTSQKTWVNACLIHVPVSIPSKDPFPGNCCILSRLKNKIIHLPSEVLREPVKK